jgi:hypothetical protein
MLLLVLFALICTVSGKVGLGDRLVRSAGIYAGIPSNFFSSFLDFCFPFFFFFFFSFFSFFFSFFSFFSFAGPEVQ